MKLSKIWVVSSKLDDKGSATAEVAALEAYRASPKDSEYSSVQWSGIGRPAVGENLQFSLIEVKLRVSEFVNPLGALNGLFQMAAPNCKLTIGSNTVDQAGKSKLLLFAALLDTYLVGYSSKPPNVCTAFRNSDPAILKENYSSLEILNYLRDQSETDHDYWKIGPKDFVDLIEFIQIQKLFSLPSASRIKIDRIKGNRSDKQFQKMQLSFEIQEEV
jgi:hypothetical protein